jgi:hypothetical protein
VLERGKLVDFAHELMLEGHTLLWDDTRNRLTFRGRTLILSPTQYRICRAFLVAHAASSSVYAAHLFILSYVPTAMLQEQIEIFSKELLQKHISRLNQRLDSFAFHIAAFQEGYLLTVASTVSSPGMLPYHTKRTVHDTSK